MDKIKNQFLDKLIPEIEKSGFKWNKSKSTFYRTTKTGWHSFIVIFKDYPDGYEVYVSIGIRNDKVENIFHLTSGFEVKYQKYTPTIGVFISEYETTKNHRYQLHLPDDIPVVVNNLIDDYSGIADKYYKDFDDVIVMDKLLNDSPAQYCVHKPAMPLKAQTGLILAKLSGRKNYVEVEKIYKSILEEMDDGFYLQYFNPLSINLKQQNYK